LHNQGQPEQALVFFREALALDTSQLHAANACASALMDLGRSREAFHLLNFRRTEVLQDADSACNWAIVCEQVQQLALATEGYEAALKLQPQHLRALNNSALLAARAQRWSVAISRLEAAYAQLPSNAALGCSLCDVLIASHENERALVVVEALLAYASNAGLAQLLIRRATLWAFNQHWEQARQALAALNPSQCEQLMPYLESIGISASRFGWHAKRLPEPEMLYQLHAFKALLDADWRGHLALQSLMAQWIKQSHDNLEAHDWRDLQFFALMLPLSEELQGQSLQDGRRYFVKRAGQQLLPAWREHEDGRIHLAIAAQDQGDERQRCLLSGWLSRLDRQRFAVHLFAQTPAPNRQRDAAIAKLADSYTDIAHLGALDAVQKIRSIHAHIFVDTAYYTPSCRAELPFFGVAPVQLRHISWQRLNPGTVQFIMGDHFTHPHGYPASSNHHGEVHGPTLRLPHSCWLHCDDTPPAATPERKALGLPEDALVLCSRVGTPMIGPDTFALWMQILRELPHAVLWLPSYEVTAQNNLRLAAQAAQVNAQRILFAPPAPRMAYLAQLKCADLFLDPLLFNANHGLAEALRMGVPAVSCAGHNMASRLGGSILHAAGLGDQVFDSEVLGVRAARDKYAQRVIELGSQPSELAQLKAQLQAAQSSAAFFNHAMHVAQWQAAFEIMATQARRGEGFTAQDVPTTL
jgi:protein O-GlcNAc transferase